MFMVHLRPKSEVIDRIANPDFFPLPTTPADIDKVPIGTRQPRFRGILNVGLHVKNLRHFGHKRGFVCPAIKCRLRNFPPHKATFAIRRDHVKT